MRHLLLLAFCALALPWCTLAADFLSPADSAKTFHVTDPALTWELVLAEPDIAQPIFINWDERGRLWVCEYRQYPAPAGLTPMSHDEFWRTIYDKIPAPPPNGPRGADRITIHEDTDGDGKYDKHTVFLDGLNICTAIEHGRGGHFVLQPPYLLFYADKNHDDIPDGPPEVLLAGLGIEDTHSVANSLRWGPDGWLYAAHGSTVTSRVTRPGIDKPGAPPAMTMVGQGIWRYHPETHRVEVFAEGGGNTFGVEFDAQGRLFSGHNGGDTRGFEYVQGAYERKGFEKHGQLSNPYAYGFYEPMKSDKTERFTHNFIIYEGGALGEKYEGKLFGIEPLQGRLVLSERYADASTFGTHDLGRIVTSDDKWFRPVDIKAGPDGAIYVADFHEPEISHLKHRTGPVYSQTGRIWRLRSSSPTASSTSNTNTVSPTSPRSGKTTIAVGERSEPAEHVSPNAKPRSGDTKTASFTSDDPLKQPASLRLFDVLAENNKWRRQTALRLLADSRDEVLKQFDSENKSYILADPDRTKLPKSIALKAYYFGLEMTKFGLQQRQLDFAWATEVLFENKGAIWAHFQSPEPLLREWAVRASGDRNGDSDLVLSGSAELQRIHNESAPRVRHQLAASARRLPAAQGLPIIRELLLHDEDAKDPRIPLMLWWAIENKCASEREAVLALLKESPLWDHPIVRDEILERLMRRFAQSGTRPELLSCAQLLDLAPTHAHAKILMTGFEKAFQGRSLANLPEELARAIAKHGGASLPLNLRLGDPAAKAAALKLLTDAQAPELSVVSVLSVLSELKIPEARAPLLALLERLPTQAATPPPGSIGVPPVGPSGVSHDPKSPTALESTLYSALQQFDDPEIATQVVARLKKIIPSQSSASSVLTPAPNSSAPPPSGESVPSVQSVVPSAAFTLLATRPQWSLQLAQAVRGGTIPRESIPLPIVRRLKLYKDPTLVALANDLWPGTGSPTTAEMEKTISRLTSVADSPGGNPYRGRELFATCAACHTLHGEGGHIGPDLTSYQRDNLNALLTAIVNPSAEIREGYENLTLTTNDGRTLAGFLAEQDDQTLTLRTLDNQTLTLPKTQIATKTPSGQSLMPEGLLNTLDDPAIRDLFAYLRSSQPLPAKRPAKTN